MPILRNRPVLSILLALALCAPAGAQTYDVTVQRGQYGIPHITASDYSSLAYGYAATVAEDNICILAESYVTVNAERSRHFGPDKGYTIRGNGSTPNNLNSDFFYQAIKDEQRVEKLLAIKDGPNAVRPELREAVHGFVAGYNAYLSRIGGADGVSDPACKGKPWVASIDEMTVWRRFYSLALLASSGVAIDGIAGAQPPAHAGGEDEAEARAAGAVAALRPGEFDERMSGLGSNAVALGSEATESRRGILFGNPHFPWEGSERFYQSHLTIPGKLNVAGGSLMGVPVINIGWTNGVAWSHTVSTARRFTPFELRLVPGSPTTYLYDNQPREMTRRKVTVQALGADGKLEPRSRTLYSSHHGPILTSILGLPLFPWTHERAYAMGDVNADNFGRLLNHFFDVNHAQSVEEVDAILKKYVGIPWVNTIATDGTGKAYYADIGSIPNVSRVKLQACRVALGVALDAAARLPVLDGSRSACEWDTDPDAPRPGIFGPRNLPQLTRSDYTANMNDSYWLTNPRQPLEGFSPIIGDERTARSLRTRMGIRLIEEGLDKGGRFDLGEFYATSFSNRVMAAELWRDELVAMCRQFPFVPSASGPTSTAGACDALAAFDGRDDLDSKGAVLFRRFAIKALGAAGGPYRTGFSAEDPVNTPHGLRTEHPQVRQALGDAIRDLQTAGIPLDSPLRGVQYERRGERRMPIHGGPHATGVFNVITALWNGKDYGDINHGSSHVQWVELGSGCPTARSILTYSQSLDPTSRYFADQTELYEGKKWVEIPFCAQQMRRARLRAVRLVERQGVLRRLRVTDGRGRRRPLVALDLVRQADVAFVARRGRSTRRMTRRGLRAGRHTIRLRLPRGTWRLTVIARAGRRVDSYRVRVVQR